VRSLQCQAHWRWHAQSCACCNFMSFTKDLYKTSRPGCMQTADSVICCWHPLLLLLLLLLAQHGCCHGIAVDTCTAAARRPRQLPDVLHMCCCCLLHAPCACL
jgi:hypothetical protein